MKGIVTGVFVAFLLLACKSPHKFADTEYVDLSQGQPLNPDAVFPAELGDSLGWGQLSELELKKNDEEIRFTLYSQKKPFHLFRITKKGKKIKGESILYWPKEKGMDLQSPYNNMWQYLNKRCADFAETPNYDYCTPVYTDDVEPNWEAVYNALQGSGIWKTPDGDALSENASPSEMPWTLNIQLRIGDYYRELTHSNPEQYIRSDEYLRLMSVVSQLKGVTSRFRYAENFDGYEGITRGEKGSKLILCDQSEAWRFNSDLGELINKAGVPAAFDIRDSLMFYVKVQGEVHDEWYSERERSGFQRTIVASELNDFAVVSELKCPGN